MGEDNLGAVCLDPQNAQAVLTRLFGMLNGKRLDVMGIYVNGTLVRKQKVPKSARVEEEEKYVLVPLVQKNTRLRREGDKNYCIFPGISILQGDVEITKLEAPEGELTLIFRGEKWATPLIRVNSTHQVMVVFCPDYVEVMCSLPGEEQPKTYRFTIKGKWTQKHEDAFRDAEKRKKEDRKIKLPHI